MSNVAQFSWATDQTVLTQLINKAGDNWLSGDFDRILAHVNIEGGQESEDFLRFLDKTVDGIDTINGVPATQSTRKFFQKRLLNELDARRFAQVDDILREAATRFPNLEAAVRTGSSGLRHLGQDTQGSYRPLLSDDDITFVGEGAQEAKSWFNHQIRSRGLDGVKVRGGVGLSRGLRNGGRPLLPVVVPESAVKA